MRKKLILINSLIIVFTLLFSLVYNIISFSKMNMQSTKNELTSYLNIVINSYNSSNEDEVVKLFENASQNIRVTIIDRQGNVMADSSMEDIFTNHLFRDEIKNLGKFVERTSPTLGIKMLYLATEDDGAYVRVAVEVSSINQYIWSYILTDGLTTILLLAISIGLLIIILRKYLNPLSQATIKLEKITNSNPNTSLDSLESLINSIDKASDTIMLQMKDLKEEKDKIVYIMNHISQGVIIINGNDDVELINSFSLKALDLREENVLSKNYIYCFRNKEINERILQVSKSDSSITNEVFLNGFTYQITINKFDDKIAILLTDITKFKNLDYTKREFFQNASHELKSPLTSIIGYQQMIKEGILTDEEEIKEATAKTIIEANRMNDTIIEMLDLSKLESQISYELENVLLSVVIEEALNSVENELLLKKIKVETNIDSSMIMGCKEHLYSLVKNVIDNAVKYNKDGGQIIISLKDGFLVIEDTGVGIEGKNISRIFERFYRVDKAKSKALGSTGLGLAIVKHICKMYKYEIDVTSTLGVGTKFCIKFRQQ